MRTGTTRNASLVVLVSIAFLLSGMAAQGPVVKAAELDEALKQLPKVDWGQSRATFTVIDNAVVASHGNAAARRSLERRLVAALKSDATRAAKQFICRKLSVFGSANCVPAVAALLTDKDLSHMARYALERMPYPAAVGAMREALPKVSGRLKVGVINSLGVRRDGQAAGALAGLLKDADAEIAGAAATALGKIATLEAAKALADFRAKAPKELHGIAVDASLDVARQLLKDGNKQDAGKIYEELYSKKEADYVRTAAIQGLVAARPSEATGLLTRLLAGDDRNMRGLAVRLINEVPGTEATKEFASFLPKLPPDGQAALLGALGTRQDAAAKPAVLAMLKSQDELVRVAAVGALASVGGASDVPLLAKIAAADKGGQTDAARKGLATLKGEDVNKTMLAAMRGADARVQVELIRGLAARAAKESVGTLLKSAEASDAAVRQAALEALGALADENQTATLVRLLKTAKSDAERQVAEKALAAVSVRGREKCAPAILAGLRGADTASRCALLRVLGRARGSRALAAVRSATGDKDEKVQDVAIRVLSEWADFQAASALLQLAKTAEKTTHQVLALRGYVRLVKDRKAPDNEKLSMLTGAMDLAKRRDDKKLVLGALGEVRTPGALKLVTPHLSDKALAEDAGAVAVRIADRIAGRNKDLVRTAMEQVLKVVKNRRTRNDAQKVLKKVR